MPVVSHVAAGFGEFGKSPYVFFGSAVSELLQSIIINYGNFRYFIN